MDARIEPGREYEVIQSVLHGDLASQTLFDFDGVLTTDIFYDEPDVASYDELMSRHSDHPYVAHLHDAHPFLIPSKPILGIVTGRLPIYKDQCHAWLARYSITPLRGITFSIYRRQSARAAAKGTMGYTGHQKAKAYADLADARLFIESSHRQSRLIHEVSQKPVFCLEKVRILM